MNSTGTKLSTLRVGIIGYGKVGKIRHGCITRHPFLELIGIYDLDVGACQDSGDPKNQSLFLGVTFFTDYRELLNVPSSLLV